MYNDLIVSARLVALPITTQPLTLSLWCCCGGNAFASDGVTGLRGVTVDVAILEEAVTHYTQSEPLTSRVHGSCVCVRQAFVDESMFDSVCTPLLGVNHTALLGISTPDDEENYYSQLLEMQGTDGPLFHQIRVGLSCQTCIENGVECNCKVENFPSWKSEERHEMTQKMLAHKKEVADRETRGLIKSARRCMFAREWVKAFRLRAPYKLELVPPVIFVAIDPSGGGKHSEFAICSFIFQQSRHVVRSHSVFCLHPML